MIQPPEKPIGAAAIEPFIKNLPGTPGVYRMLDSAGDALYVGKAKNLKKRVSAYTQPQKHTIRIQRMIAQTVTMEFVTTHTEAEAFLLEANLIKKLKPRYNILLRDDKSFPYILITDHDFPQVTKHRGAKDQAGEYFGPFASGYAVNETLAILQKAFLLRNCTDNVFALRTRPCLLHQIKRCTAPCVKKVSQDQYAAQVDMARQFLNGRSRQIQEEFVEQMQKASAAEDFETAAFLRDRIKALTSVQSHQNIHVDGLPDVDIIALYRKAGLSCIQVFFFRAGQNFGNRAYFPRHEKDESDADILSAFIGQFYASKMVPKNILVSGTVTEETLLEEALASKAGYKVSISTPLRGQRKELIDMALKNARESFARKMAEQASQNELFEKIAEIFGLDGAPERIEIYDNSHISGTNATGAMVVATPEGFQKNSYRRYNIKDASIRPGDDYGMMRHMLTRRFQSLAKDLGGGSRPDLLLIDGGQGQLSACLKVMADLGVTDIPVVAVSKGPDRNAGREKFHMAGREAFDLLPDDPALYFLQRLRDEAHRFAITTHRAKRTKALMANPLDSLPGIGAKRKKALLLHFGSAKAVAEAGVADLQKVAGISKAVAQKIYAFFHGDE